MLQQIQYMYITAEFIVCLLHKENYLAKLGHKWRYFNSSGPNENYNPEHHNINTNRGWPYETRHLFIWTLQCHKGVDHSILMLHFCNWLRDDSVRFLLWCVVCALIRLSPFVLQPPLMHTQLAHATRRYAIWKRQDVIALDSTKGIPTGLV